MARIRTYEIDNNITDTDVLLGTDSDDLNKSKNFLLSGVAKYIAGKINLFTTTDNGTGMVNLGTQAISILGTVNEIETSGENQVIKIGLPDDVTVTNNLTVGNNTTVTNALNVNGATALSGILNVTGAATFNNNLNVAGTGNFTGQVTIPVLPAANTDAASKKYVDDQAISLKTEGTSGDATLIDGVLNIPNYSYTPPTVAFQSLTTNETSGEATLVEGVLNIPNYTSTEKVIQTVRMGEAVSKGDPLVITGYHGSNGPAIVERADATFNGVDGVTKMPAYGVALEDYASNAPGLMIAVGDFNDFDTSGYEVGDTLYVAVGGGMTNIKPTGTALIQNMGIVSRKNANNGDVEIVAIGRTNDVPNLPKGRLFVGTSDNTSLTSDVVYIDDTENKVGIGTVEPSESLHVEGNTLVSGRLDANQVRADSSYLTAGVVLNSSGDGSHIRFKNNGTEADAYVQTRGGHVGIGGFRGHSSNNINISQSDGFLGIKQRNPLAPLHIKRNGEAIRLESTGDEQCSIDFWQAATIDKEAGKRGHIEFSNNTDTIEIKATNPSGPRSIIKFSVALEDQEATEAMRIQRHATTGNKQVVIGNPEIVLSSRELYVQGEIHTSGTLNVFDGGLSVGGRVDADSFKLKGLNTAPQSSTDSGTNGEIRYTADYIYVCVQNNVWKRVALQSF